MSAKLQGKVAVVTGASKGIGASIALHLARYACQLGRLEEAKAWIKKAVSLEDAGDLMSRALKDPDLAPLWPYYGKLSTAHK